MATNSREQQHPTRSPLFDPVGGIVRVPLLLLPLFVVNVLVFSEHSVPHAVLALILWIILVIFAVRRYRINLRWSALALVPIAIFFSYLNLQYLRLRITDQIQGCRTYAQLAGDIYPTITQYVRFCDGKDHSSDRNINLIPY